MNDSERTLETLEIVGGGLCLDFANTINSRLDPEHDYLIQYNDLVGWAKKVGILTSAQAEQLRKHGKRSTDEAEHTLQTARRIRELIYAIFSNTARGMKPAQEDMDFLVQLYAEALSHSSFSKADDHYIIAWNVEEALDALLWPIIHSAGELLLSSNLDQVKECPGCGWLFLDTSKNQSRRWCSMNTCGSRDKMRRYHQRKRTK